MKKIWVLCLPILAMLSLTSCASSAYVLPTPIDEPSTSVNPTTDIPITIPSIDPPEFQNWLSPAKVTISNFHAGAMAEYAIIYHNAKQITTDQKKVTTGDNETIGDIPLNSAGLYLDDIVSVTELKSDNPQDNLILASYDKKTNSLLVGGFAPNSERILTTTYKPMTAYAVYARIPDNGITDSVQKAISQDWIIAVNPTLVLAPLETANDTITISMPFNETLPDKTWEFWVGVTELSKSSGVAVSLEIVSRWVVEMKGS